MTHADDEVRTAFESNSESLPGDHPDPGRLWAAAAGELGSGESRELIDHLSRCPACAEDFRITRQLAGEAQSESPAAAKGHVRSPSGRWWVPASIAAATLTVALGTGYLSKSPESAYREDGAEQIQSRLAAGTSLPRERLRLQWSAPPGSRFNVRVTTEDLEVVVEARGLAKPELVIGEESLAELPSGTPLYWEVEAVLPDGSRIESPAYKVLILDE